MGLILIPLQTLLAFTRLRQDLRLVEVLPILLAQHGPSKTSLQTSQARHTWGKGWSKEDVPLGQEAPLSSSIRRQRGTLEKT